LITIEELFDQVDMIVEIIEENRKKISPRMNLLDITGVSHLEVKNSNILAFLLDPHAPHKRPEIGSLFLEHLKRKVPDSIYGTTLHRVCREQVTSCGRFIDLFLETDQGEYIIIENKVNAGDLDKQLEDYIKWVQDTFKKNPLAVYLTTGGTFPAENSLKKDLREKMENESRFLCLSYQDDVVAWLKKVLSIIADGTDTKLLQSAIVQYQDAVIGFCGQREEDVMEKAEIVENLIGHYGLTENSGPKIKELQAAAIGFQSAMDQIVIMQFLIDLYEVLRQDGNDRVYLTVAQDRKSDIKSWLKACKGVAHNIGVELALEAIEQKVQYGIGIEFSEITRETSVCFGMMAHGEGSISNVPYRRIPMNLLKEVGEVSSSINKYWWENTLVNQPWFNQTLFLYGPNARWQDSEGNLTNHVAKWFLVDDLHE
jgi:hypothetical protein